MASAGDLLAALLVSHTVHNRATTRQRGPSKLTATSDETKDSNDLPGRVHLDRRHRADRQAALEDQGADGQARIEARGPADLGLRRLEHEPGAREQLGLRAAAGVRLPGSDPGWRQ